MSGYPAAPKVDQAKPLSGYEKESKEKRTEEGSQASSETTAGVG